MIFNLSSQGNLRAFFLHGLSMFMYKSNLYMNIDNPFNEILLLLL